MSMTQKAMEKAAAEAVREWPQRVKDAGVKLDNGWAYHPTQWANKILTHLDNPHALVEYARSIFNCPLDTFGAGEGGRTDTSAGWDRICSQAGYELTWEWILLDPAAPWAALFTNAERQRVLNCGRAS